MQLALQEDTVVFQPSLEDVATSLHESCTTLAKSARDIKRPETKIFPALAEEQLFLPTGEVDDEVVRCSSVWLELTPSTGRQYAEHH